MRSRKSAAALADGKRKVKEMAEVMELEFDVKITADILYDYMLRHTYASASGLIGAVSGILMMAAYFMGAGVLSLIAGIIVLVYLPWTLFLKSRQQYLSNPAFKKPLHYKFTQEGVEVSQGEEVQMQKWEDMYKAVSTPKSLILYTSPVNACIFPKKDLGEKKASVIEAITGCMPSGKAKIRR